MGISNQIPNSRLAQAGVVPDTANRPASPYEGQMLYQKDTNQVLVYDGSAWVMLGDTDQPPGLQLIKTQTVGTGVSSIEVTGAFDSVFENYRIIYTGGTGSGSANLTMKLGSTTSGYYSALTGVTTAGAASLGYRNNSESFFDWCGYMTTSAALLEIDLFGPNLSKPTFGKGTLLQPAGSLFMGMHYESSTTQHTSFTIATSANTLTGGTIRVYGYRNS